MDPATFLNTARAAGSLFRSGRLAERWGAGSALREFRVSGLAGHLGRATLLAESALDNEVRPDVPPIDAATYYLVVPDPTDITTPGQRRIRDVGEQDAGTGPDDLAARHEAAVDRLAARLPAEPPDRLVGFSGAAGYRTLTLTDWLTTRLVELVVHLDDLAVSLDLPTPEVPPEAAGLVVTTLARIAQLRHGAVPVVRLLARAERADGPVTAF